MNEKLRTEVPLTQRQYDEDVGKLICILAEVGVGVKDRSQDDGRMTYLSLDNGVDVEIDTEIDTVETIAEDVRVERVRYTVGYYQTVYGGYWDPPDAEFLAMLETYRLWDAVQEVLLLPKRWEIDGILEAAALKIDRGICPENGGIGDA